MSAVISLRAAGPADASEIHRLILALADYERADVGAVLVTPEVLHAQLSAERPPFECILAEIETRGVVGFALFFHNYSTWLGRHGLYLEDLFVLPEVRGSGVGKALFMHIAAIARERHCGRMEWAVLDWNTPAIEFYERLEARPLSEWTIFRVTDEALLRVR